MILSRSDRRIIHSIQREARYTITHKYDRVGEPCFCDTRSLCAQLAILAILLRLPGDFSRRAGKSLYKGYFSESMKVLLEEYPHLRMAEPIPMHKKVLDTAPYEPKQSWLVRWCTKLLVRLAYTTTFNKCRIDALS